MANKTVLVRNAEELDEAITKSGYSYRRLAKEVGCSQTQISLIMKGERNPSPELAVNICRVLKGLFDDFFYINNDYKRKQKMLKQKTR